MAPFPQEQVLDEMYDVIAKMLTQEERFNDAFSSIYALSSYIKKIAFRAIIRRNKKLLQRTVPLDPQLAGEEASPEELLLSALEYQTLSEVTKQALDMGKLSSKIQVDLEILFAFLKQQGTEYIKKRQSGEDRGRLALDFNGLANALGWNRNRLYDRVERLRKLLTVSLEECGYKST